MTEWLIFRVLVAIIFVYSPLLFLIGVVLFILGMIVLYNLH
jgi:hypothetical protein